MKLYFFFCIDREGDREYGEQYFVMSQSLEAAKNAVINSPAWERRGSIGSSIESMGVQVVGENEVIETEMS